MSAPVATADSKIIQKDYFKKIKFVLKINGISFTGDEGLAYRVYSFIFWLLFNFIYPLLDAREVFVNPVDVVADLLMFVLVMNEIMIKVLVIRRNRLRLGKLLNKLEEKPCLPDFERGGDDEQKLIGDCLWITNKQATVYWAFMYTTLTYNMLHSLFSHIRSNNYQDWILPYGPITILNLTYSTNYKITWLYQNVSVYSLATEFCTIDLLVAGILAHISFQFKVLQNNFKRIVENSYRDMLKEENVPSSSSKDINVSGKFDTSTIQWKYLKKSLKDAVEYHLAITDLVNEMEEVLSDLLLVVMLSALTILALIIYHAAQLSFSDSDMVGTIGEVIVNWMQVAVICYWGNEVILESQRHGNVILESNFLGTDIRFQKGLAFVIRRSQNPTKLTAGKFTDISLITLVWVMRASYSSFTLLKNTSTNNK